MQEYLYFTDLGKHMIVIEPIGIVKNSRLEIEDDNWGGIVSEIVINEVLGEESLKGLEEFSHAEIIFHFHQVDEGKIVTGARHPRNNPDWPKIGIFAQRGKNRPNRLGLAFVKIIKVENGSLFVSGLDAIDETPVIDIKPVMKEFLAEESIRQPRWSTEIMENYWNDVEG
jgi:tRNA-Thr(GGU) m(6)t(6)A37 methyltransferase TsaA